MILQSLVEYYEILAKANGISKPGYCKANVSYAVSITAGGKLAGIIPLKNPVQRGNKMVEIPQSFEVPEQVKKTVGITSNFLCENSGYMLGIDNKGKPERSRECFEAFKELHREVLMGADCDEARAVLAFLEQWDPQQGQKNPVLAEYLDALTSGANLVFMLEGSGYIHENGAIKKAWEKYYQQSRDAVVMQCLVTGERLPIARLHPSVKGVKGAQSMGASLVSFNANAYESHGRDDQQGLNAPVSEYAAFAYTTTLNYLLADSKHRQTLGDTTVVFWAQSAKSIYRDLFAYALNPDTNSTEKTDDKGAASLIGNVFNKIASGMPVAELNDAFNPSTAFYILGLSPNAARLAVRFFIQDTFGNFIERIARHYKDMEINRAPTEQPYLPLWQMMQETVSPKSKDKASSPLLSGSVLRSILTGSPYPAALYGSVIVRIRAEKAINSAKAGIIKAYLTKKHSGNNTKDKEVLTVSLNAQSENRAYVLGRLFSVLEKAQQDANPGINTTIKDRYFTSACATPASVFPVLLRLSNHHISKSDFGKSIDNKIRDLMDKLDVDEKPFPAHLTLDEQGVFILGYYHQKQANYEKTNKEGQ